MSRVKFQEAVALRQQETGSWVCAGFDPDRKKFPKGMGPEPESMLRYCCYIVDAVAPSVCVVKPNFGFWSAAGAFEQLRKFIGYVQGLRRLPVILDWKSGDVGPSAEQYAEAIFGYFNADAVTVNPLPGQDTIAPFATYDKGSRGVIALCKMSNKSSSTFMGEGVVPSVSPALQPLLYQRIATEAVSWHQQYGNVGLVVGATFPEELAEVRRTVGSAMLILSPGIGRQKGDLDGTLNANDDGFLTINSSSGILHALANADKIEDAAAAAGKAAEQLRDQIRSFHSVAGGSPG